MNIEKVELLGFTDEEKENGMRPQFYIKTVEGDKLYAPIDPSNRHYQEVRAWYREQDHKPFEFEFED